MTITNSPVVNPSNNSAYDSNPAPANFIVLGHARCGSNLLGRSLGMHPQVRMGGELLAHEDSTRTVAWERVNPAAWPRPRGKAYQEGEDAAAFISQRVFSPEPFENIRAFGFKIFYDHSRKNEASKTIWQYFATNPVRVIHLHRRNLFASFVSNEVALKTNEWHLAADAARPEGAQVPPFAINSAHLEHYFEEIINWRRWADETFANHDVLRISYENELCEDFGAAANKAYKFIGVIPWISRPWLQKQQAVPLEEQVSNYSALRKCFRDTPYAEFFTADDSDASVPGSQRKGVFASLFGRK